MKLWMPGALLMLAPLTAEAQNWRAIGFGGADADTMLLYVDHASLKRTGATTRELTLASAYDQPRSLVGELKYSWVLTSYAVDCTAKTAHTLMVRFHAAGGEVLISNSKPGNPISLTATAMVPKALNRACTGDFSTLFHSTSGALYPDAKQRFAWRAALRAATRNTGWVRTGMEGVAPNRAATFVHRASIITDSAGRKFAPLLTIMEDRKPGHTNRYFNYTRFDCVAGTRGHLYAELYAVDGTSKENLFPGDAEGMKMEGNSVFSSPLAPLCRNDWTKAKQMPVSPATLPVLAFIP